ncbi:hypothetical protein ABPG75_004657 [Micractinium tetrahymenae]
MTPTTSQAPGEPAAVDFVARLPAALTTEVLARLGGDPRDLAAASAVCRNWRAAAAGGDVWAAAYAARFPSWSSERALAPALPGGAAPTQLADAAWQQRYRWRLGLDRHWRQGRRRLQHVLHGHAAWVNAVRLLPSACGGGGVASGGSEGAVHVWGLDGELHLFSNLHGQAVWALDADAQQIATGAMDGFVHLLDLGSEAVTARLPAGWRGGAAPPPAEAGWEQFEVVTSVQLLPGGKQLLVGCMDGLVQLVDLRCKGAAAQQLHWAAPAAQPAAGAAPGGLFWRRRRGAPRLAAARCHEHLLVGAGDAPAVSLHDLRAGGARFAELALRAPSVFALDLQYPRLATGGDGGHLEVWDVSRLGGTVAAVLPAVARRAQPCQPRLVCSLFPASVSRESAGEGTPAAASSLDCMVGSNEGHLQRGLHMGCVYSARLLEDWRLLTADHGGYVRLWCTAEAAGEGPPTLASLPAFAPSVDDPAAAMIDPAGGPPRPVGMHCLDACLTHLAVAGRDSVVRVYSYE